MRKCKLKELIEVTRGASLAGEYYSTEGELIRLTLGNFDYNNGGFKENTSKEDIFFTGEVKDEFILEKGDIITPLTEQAIGLLGTTAKIPEGGKYIQSQDVALVKCNDSLYPGYCYYLLPSSIVKKQLSAGAQQTSIRHTSPDKIKDCWVYIPDYSDQKKIADFMDVIDRKISLNRRMNATLEAMAKHLYDYWFVQFDFPDSNGKPYKSSGGKMVWNEKLKREIPEGWEGSNICKIADILSGGTPSKQVQEYWNGNIPFFGPTDLVDSIYQISTAASITEEGLKHCSSLLYEENTIFITARGSIGKLVLVGTPMAMNQSCYALSSKNINHYSYLYFLTKQLIQHLLVKGSGSTFKSIISQDIESTILAIAATDVIEKYCNKANNIFENIKNNTEEISTLTSLRNYLLPLLMNGQVEIKE